MASAPIPVLISEEATRLPFVQAMVDFASRLASDRSAQVAAKRRLKQDHATAAWSTSSASPSAMAPRHIASVLLHRFTALLHQVARGASPGIAEHR